MYILSNDDGNMVTCKLLIKMLKDKGFKVIVMVEAIQSVCIQISVRRKNLKAVVKISLLHFMLVILGIRIQHYKRD